MEKSRLGILGSGQLARMLALSAAPLGLEVSILATHSTDPAAQVSNRVTLGSLDDAEVLRKFLHELDFVTVESEFIDTDKLARSLPSQAKMFPAPNILSTIQDRLTQKQLLDRFKIPTSPWIPVNSRDDLKAAAKEFPDGFVLKQRRFGYDGYGTFVYKPLLKVPLEIHDFTPLDKSPHGFIAEELVNFKRELATSFVRSAAEKFVMLPLVESVQQESRCFSVRGPLPAAKLGRMKSAIKRLMDTIDYQGILAVEMFEVEGRLLINELAPRVHNSAHYSQDALSCSQFEYHLRAGLDWPLPPVQLLSGGFAMVNLLGEGHPKVELSRSALGNLHWYGKSENRSGRKLGHLNVLAKSSAQALRAALKWRKEFKL